MERIGKIFKFMKEHDLPCIAIKDVYTIRYLTGFTGDSGILYADDRIAVLVTEASGVVWSLCACKFHKKPHNKVIINILNFIIQIIKY